MGQCRDFHLDLVRLTVKVNDPFVLWAGGIDVNETVALSGASREQMQCQLWLLRCPLAITATVNVSTDVEAVCPNKAWNEVQGSIDGDPAGTLNDGCWVVKSMPVP